MKICLCGRVDRDEFCQTARDASEIVARANGVIARASCVAELTREVAELRDVDFFLLLRSFPSEFSALELESLRRAAPLAPIAIISGELCEGENRAGERFHGARRFYVREWRDFWRAEFEKFCDPRGARGLFTAPATSLDVDLILSRPHARKVSHRSAVVFSNNAASRVALVELLVSAGYNASWRRLASSQSEPTRGAEPDVVVVDCCADIISTERITVLNLIRAQFPQSFLAILTFAPGQEETRFFSDAQRWGRARVFGKPLDVEAFLNAVDGSRNCNVTF